MLNDFLSIIRKRKYYSKFVKKNSNSLTAKAIFLKIELDFPLLIKNNICKFQNPMSNGFLSVFRKGKM